MTDDQTGTSIELGAYGGWSVFSPKLQSWVCLWGGALATALLELLVVGDMLENTLRSTAALTESSQHPGFVPRLHLLLSPSSPTAAFLLERWWPHPHQVPPKPLSIALCSHWSYKL